MFYTIWKLVKTNYVCTRRPNANDAIIMIRKSVKQFVLKVSKIVGWVVLDCKCNVFNASLSRQMLLLNCKYYSCFEGLYMFLSTPESYDA